MDRNWSPGGMFLMGETSKQIIANIIFFSRNSDHSEDKIQMS